MDEAVFSEVDQIFKNKIYLTIQDVADLLGCDPQIVFNWTRRSDPRKRPPRILVGKDVRFPKRDLVRWLAQEQLDSGV